MAAQPLASATDSLAGGSVRVRANDRLDNFGIVGAVAGGVAGIGVSVFVLNITSNTDAGISGSSVITAGPGGTNVVSTHAEMIENTTAIGVAGGGGFVGIGAQVVVLNDGGKQSSHVDSGAAIKQAGGGLDVTVDAHRNIPVYAIGVGLGAGATGAGVAVVNVNGGAKADVGDVALSGSGPGFGPVGKLNVVANDIIDASTLAIAVAGGVGLVQHFLRAGGIHRLARLVGEALTVRGLVVQDRDLPVLEFGREILARDPALLVVAAAHAENVGAGALVG